MLDDFFIRAIVTCFMIALLAAPLGCLAIWKRMANFSDALAHSTLPAISVALIFHLNIFLAVIVVVFIVSLALVFLRYNARLPLEALLVILSHGFLALGLLIHSQFGVSRLDLFALLTGDILATSQDDIGIIIALTCVGIICLFFTWRPMLLSIVNADLSFIYLRNPFVYEIIFFILLSVFIAFAIKIVGVLLISAILIIPAAIARQLSYSPTMMVIIAGLFSITTCMVGLLGSFWFDLPAGPTIVIALLLIFMTLHVILYFTRLLRF